MLSNISSAHGLDSRSPNLDQAILACKGSIKGARIVFWAFAVTLRTIGVAKLLVSKISEHGVWLGVACHGKTVLEALVEKDARIGAIIETYCMDIR